MDDVEPVIPIQPSYPELQGFYCLDNLIVVLHTARRIQDKDHILGAYLTTLNLHFGSNQHEEIARLLISLSVRKKGEAELLLRKGIVEGKIPILLLRTTLVADCCFILPMAGNIDLVRG